MASIGSVDISPQPTGFMTTQPSSGAQVGSVNSLGGQEYSQAGFAFPDGSEMDITGDKMVDQPSPATVSSQSRGGSTSQSSYSPGNFNDHHLPYRASPTLRTGHMTGVTTGNASVFANYDGSAKIFSNGFSVSGNADRSVYGEEFLVNSDWEFSAMTAGTGMTPMNDGTWDSMLESVTMGWDTNGTPGDLRGASPGAS